MINHDHFNFELNIVFLVDITPTLELVEDQIRSVIIMPKFKGSSAPLCMIVL